VPILNSNSACVAGKTETSCPGGTETDTNEVPLMFHEIVGLGPMILTVLLNGILFMLKDVIVVDMLY